MRYFKYLNETTGSTFKEASNIINKYIPKIMDDFQKLNWNISDKNMLSTLNKYFRKDQVVFKTGKSEGPNNYNKTVQSGETFDTGKIEIILLRGASKKISKHKNHFLEITQNLFMRDIWDILNHELIHKQQAKKSKGKAFIDYYDLSNPIEYLSDPAEIEAFAQQAAIDINRGIEEPKGLILYQSFFSEDHPKIWKRFLKKLEFYLR